jgi:protein tyrosine phosphatase (PTP) superfamily phosphohydrolase (DUF442 family)
MIKKLRFLFAGILAFFFQTAFVQSGEVLLVRQEVRTVPVPLKAAGVTNLFRLSDRIYSGAAPEGDAGFQSLQKLGIKTIITVDGSKPDVALAHKYGLHYVHLPHGYDGISAKTQLQLIKAAETVPGPIFVHCHHGQHRGPTAAAVICLGTEGWNRTEADSWLRTAGTATNYTGLFQTVRDFQPPTADQLRQTSSEFPETAETDDLVDTMVAIDGRWDELKAVRKAGYQTPKDHQDLDPASDSVILREHFREAQRLPDCTTRGSQFLEKLKAAEANAQAVERLLRQFKASPSANLRAQLDRTFDSMGHACSACHKSFRDPALAGDKKP